MSFPVSDLPHSDRTDLQKYELVAGSKDVGQRLDKFLSRFGSTLSVPLSRSLFNTLISDGNVLVNTVPVKVSYRLRNADTITILVPPPEPLNLIPEKIDFEILFEDSCLIVLAKPPGLVVHPACGHWTGTLVHGLLYHCHDLAGINGTVRPGIVHRLDKDTSGLLVVAKSDLAQKSLVEQFKAKTVEKVYLAIVQGWPQQEGGTISGNIGRHSVNRKKMALLENGGREAVTHWYLLEKFSSNYSLLQLQLETGRTHQIRVHLASVGLPIAGDMVYGGKRSISPGLKISRQCLHATSIAFDHPESKERLYFESPLWQDMAETLALLRG